MTKVEVFDYEFVITLKVIQIRLKVNSKYEYAEILRREIL